MDSVSQLDPSLPRKATTRGFGFPLAVLLAVAAVASSGCGKKGGSGDAANRPGSPGYLPPAVGQQFVVDGQIDLPGLTAAVRRYSQWKMRVPKDLDELVASKYLTNLPAPPPGQRYAVDPATLEVTLSAQ